jgi:predicted TIM-barrel fold metal-dependent hydrolase
MLIIILFKTNGIFDLDSIAQTVPFLRSNRAAWTPGSDYPVLQDWEIYRETFAYIERLGLPKEVTDKILYHNAPKLFGFDH